MIKIAKLLRADPALSLEVIRPHRCAGRAHNQNLSERRASAVVDALVRDHGIAAERLHARGAGMDRPIVTNDTDAARAQNRRVELVRR